MLIHTSAAPASCHLPVAKSGHDHGHHPSPNPDPHHGKSLIPMDAVHIAHDVAMIGMSLPGIGGHGGHGSHGAHNLPTDICGSGPASTPQGHSHAGHSHAGHSHAGHSHGAHGQSGPGTFDAFTKGGAVNGGLTLLSAAAAAGATYHGVRMLNHGHYAHGANHLLMGAGSGVMALAMATGNHTLHQASSVLMGAHGAMEVGLGVQAFMKAETPKGKALAATTAIHGACLAGAQMTNNALFTIPLYLGMGAATAVQTALAAS